MPILHSYVLCACRKDDISLLTHKAKGDGAVTKNTMGGVVPAVSYCRNICLVSDPSR
jgi:hypothetical protein